MCSRRAEDSADTGLPWDVLPSIRSAEIFEHLSRALVIRLKGDNHRLRQYEARELETVLERCTPHYEERPQLGLPPPNAVAQSQVLASRRTEFKKNPIGK